MHRSLPPFPAVRAFEASARHCSFKLAAEELCLTQSAISHQVKTLEDYLGVQLFLPRNPGRGSDQRRYRLSPRPNRCPRPIGSCYGPGSQRRCQWAAVGSQQRQALPRAGWCRASPRFIKPAPRSNCIFQGQSSLWISPGKMSMLKSAGGASHRPVCALIRCLTATRFPVASPALLKNGPALRHPDDLKHFTLLHDKTSNDWARWLELAGASFEAAIKGPRFAHCDLLLSAAAEGQGVALAFDVLVAGDLASGRLVRPFDLNLPPAIIYSVVTPEAWSSRPKIVAFRNWLLLETGMGKQGNSHSLAAA